MKCKYCDSMKRYKDYNFCPYCGNPVIIKEKFSGGLKPDLIIPFKLDRETAKKKYTEYIKSQKYVPKLFLEEAHIDKIMGLYVPEWLLSCDVEADLLYTAKEIDESDKDFYHLTEISEYDILRKGNFRINSLPVDGSAKMDDAVMDSIEPFDIKDAVEFNAAYLSGFFSDRYDVNLNNCLEQHTSTFLDELTH